jgi:hypothetical protein
MASYPVEMVTKAKECLSLQVALWETQRELENILQAHLGTEDDIGIGDATEGVAAGVDSRDDVPTTAAANLLDEIIANA